MTHGNAVAPGTLWLFVAIGLACLYLEKPPRRKGTRIEILEDLLCGRRASTLLFHDYTPPKD